MTATHLDCPSSCHNQGQHQGEFKPDLSPHLCSSDMGARIESYFQRAPGGGLTHSVVGAEGTGTPRAWEAWRRGIKWGSA